MYIILYIYVYYYILPSGNQTWQLEIHYKWSFVAGKINYIWIGDFPASHVWWHRRVYNMSSTWRVGPGIPTQAKAKASFDDWGCDEENDVTTALKSKKKLAEKASYVSPMSHQCLTNVSPTSCRSSPTGHDWALRARNSVSESPSCFPERYVATTVEWSRHPGLATSSARHGLPTRGRALRQKTDPVNEHLWKPTIFYRYPLGI